MSQFQKKYSFNFTECYHVEARDISKVELVDCYNLLKDSSFVGMTALQVIEDQTETVIIETYPYNLYQ